MFTVHGVIGVLVHLVLDQMKDDEKTNSNPRLIISRVSVLFFLK